MSPVATYCESSSADSTLFTSRFLFKIVSYLCIIVCLSLESIPRAFIYSKMGNQASSIHERVDLDSDEIRRLEKRFRKLDTNDSGTLSPEGAPMNDMVGVMFWHVFSNNIHSF